MSTSSSPKKSTDCRPRNVQQERPRRTASRLLTLTIFAGILLANDMQAFCGELLIEGDESAVHLEVRDVPLGRLLYAMQAKFNIRYRTDGPLDSSVTGTFDGQMRRVAARLLENYDFVMKMRPEGLDILILQRNWRDFTPTSSVPPAKEAATPAILQLTSDQILGVVLSGRLPKSKP